MTLIIGTQALGAIVASDVSVDSVSDRLLSLTRALGRPETWTVSQGAIRQWRLGAECLEVDVLVAGPFTGTCELRAGDTSVVAVSPGLQVAALGSVLVTFRVARGHEKNKTLATVL